MTIKELKELNYTLWMNIAARTKNSFFRFYIAPNQKEIFGGLPVNERDVPPDDYLKWRKAKAQEGKEFIQWQNKTRSLNDFAKKISKKKVKYSELEKLYREESDSIKRDVIGWEMKKRIDSDPLLAGTIQVFKFNKKYPRRGKGGTKPKPYTKKLKNPVKALQKKYPDLSARKIITKLPTSLVKKYPFSFESLVRLVNSILRPPPR